jgi:hypothetical protein
MRSLRAAALLFAILLAGCARLGAYRTPEGITRWQDPSPPTLSLRAKADLYQARVAALHQMPDGVIRYRFTASQARDDYGDLPDGPFFAGLYLASQALRLAASGDPAARSEVLRTLDGMALLMDVTGEPGLLARWVATAQPAVTRSSWLPSATRPGYLFRADVSKDQLAGYACGLGVALALLPDPEIRARVAQLATPLAEHLRRNDRRIVDVDGERTTHGDLRARIAGFPVGVNALIALSVAKAAGIASGDDAFSRELDEDGYLSAARTAHWRPPGYAKRVNDNMAYVSLLPLLMLEPAPERGAELREAEALLWDGVRGEHNAFFAGVHALASGDEAARAELRAGLTSFPERKQELPVDLTRPGFDFETRWWKNSKGLPRAKQPVPLYLRPAGSNLWVSDPYALVGSLRDTGGTEYSGVDYLLAYWFARAGGWVSAED